MKERPILFNGEMVRAVLDGRKTQTRRVIKPQPIYINTDANRRLITQEVTCPYGVSGDQLWVRETFALETNFDFTHDYEPPHTDGRPVNVIKREDCDDYWEQCHYRATDPTPELCYEDHDSDAPHCRWKPSIHMPRWASRIQLEVVNVRVERVQEIDNNDALAEGTPDIRTIENDFDMRECFRVLWDSINEKRGFGWESNPWVWVVEFKVLP